MQREEIVASLEIQLAKVPARLSPVSAKRNTLRAANVDMTIKNNVVHQDSTALTTLVYKSKAQT